MNQFFKFENFVVKFECALMGWLSAGALLLACFEMLMRYYFPSSLPDWTSEVVVYLITASVLASGGSLVKDGRHVYADLFVSKLSPGYRRVIDAIFCFAGAAFGLIMVVAGSDVVEFSFSLDEKSDSSLQFPVFIYYLIIPISFALITFHYLVRLYRLIFKYSSSEAEAHDSHGYSSVD